MESAENGEASGIDVVYTTVDALRPQMEGVNIICKCLGVTVIMNRRRPDGSFTKISEAKVGDATGTVLLTLRGEQVDHVKTGSVLTIVNGKVEMFKSTMRLAADVKLGKIDVAGEDGFKPKWEVNTDFDISAVEYEVVYENDTRLEKGKRDGGGAKPAQTKPEKGSA